MAAVRGVSCQSLRAKAPGETASQFRTVAAEQARFGLCGGACACLSRVCDGPQGRGLDPWRLSWCWLGAAFGGWRWGSIPGGLSRVRRSLGLRRLECAGCAPVAVSAVHGNGCRIGRCPVIFDIDSHAATSETDASCASLMLIHDSCKLCRRVRVLAPRTTLHRAFVFLLVTRGAESWLSRCCNPGLYREQQVGIPLAV